MRPRRWPRGRGRGRAGPAPPRPAGPGRRWPGRGTHRPKRSSSCGRSSPSSGFMVPTSRNRAGVAQRDPLPLDAGAAGGGGVQEHVDEVVREQVDLVDVEDAAVGRGQQPGRERVRGAGAAQDPGTSRLPVTRSSVAPSGSSTSRAGRCSARPPGGCGPSGQPGSGPDGSQEKRQPATTSTPGSTSARARTSVVLAVPFSPVAAPRRRRGRRRRAAGPAGRRPGRRPP